MNTGALGPPGRGVLASRVAYSPVAVGGVWRTAAAKFGELITAKDFGAIANGVFADDPAIKQALTTSSLVALAAGAFLATTPITIPAGETLETLGNATLSFSGAGTLLMGGDASGFISKSYGGPGSNSWAWVRGNTGAKRYSADAFSLYTYGGAGFFFATSSDDADATNTGSFYNNLVSLVRFGGANTKGNRQGIVGVVDHANGVTNSGNTGRNYVGLVGFSQSRAGDGGTDLAANAKGAYFGATAAVQIFAGTNIFAVTGAEFDIFNAAGTSMRYQMGVVVGLYNLVRGTDVDAAFVVNGSSASESFGPSVGIKTAFLLTDIGGASPVYASTVLFGHFWTGGGTKAIATAFDVTGFACSAFQFKGTGFTVDGVGALQAKAASLGTAGSALGSLALSGNTSGTVTIQPAAAAGTWTFTLPTTAGSANLFLQTNGSGVTTWATPAAAAGVALTKTDDTNVTLTLGGSPSTALVNAASITVGWSGTLALSRLAQGTDGQLIVGQTISSPLYKTLSGDATLSALGALTIANAAVTYAKMQNVAASRLLGNPTGLAAAPAEISLGATLAFSGTALQTVAQTGDVTTAANSFATTIANAAISYAKIANLGALAVMGRSANSSGVGADIQATAASDAVLRESASTIGFGTIATGGIANNAVTNAKLYQGIARSVIGVTGNVTANTADIQGTTDQVLRVNGAGTALAFGAIDLSKAAAATGVLQAASFPALTGDVTTVAGALATTIANNAVTDAKLRQGAATTVIGRSANSLGNVADIAAASDGQILRRAAGVLGFGTVPQASVDNLGLVFISTQTASASATIDFTTGLDDTYDHYLIVLDSVKPATDDVGLWLRIGTGGGPTWQTTGYRYSGHDLVAATAQLFGSTSDAKILMNETPGGGVGVGNAAGKSWMGVVRFSNPEVADFFQVTYDGQYKRSDGHCGRIIGGGCYDTASAITGIRFMMSSGNIASGRFTLYGHRKS